jgi:cytochrome P450
VSADNLAACSGAIIAVLALLLLCSPFIYAACAWLATRRRLLRGFDGPRPSFPMGNLAEIAATTLNTTTTTSSSLSRNISSNNDIHGSVFPYFARWQRVFGKVFVYWLGTEPFLYVADPEFLKSVTAGALGKSWGKPDVFRRDRMPMFGRGLVMAEGDEWARHRHIIAPAFSASNLNDMIGVMAEATSRMLGEWGASVASGEDVVDVESGVVRNAAEIIAKASFGVTDGEAGARVFRKLQAMQAMLFQSNRLVGVPMARLLHVRKTHEAWRLGREIDALLVQIIDEKRRRSSEKRRHRNKDDLLSLLLAANGQQLDEELGKKKKKKKKVLTTRELVDECKTFFFGGHETTALALSWTLLMLAAHPEWQAALREEVEESSSLQGGAGEETMTMDSLGRLTKMGWVMSEVLRLYPPSPNVQRQALVDVAAEGRSKIPAGTNMWVDVVAMHHDPALWGDDVHRFRPERFARDPVQGGCRHRMGYLPFGFGGRVCVGRNLSAMEYRVVLSMLLRRFHLSVAPEYTHAPKIMLSLRPSNGIQLRLTPIDRSSLC